jgi:Leucine-rich repeat (LRR) protein
LNFFFFFFFFFFFLQGFQFENLKHANFSYCEFITKFHASCTPNLETLVLSSCKNLVEIDASVGLLKKLKTWDLFYCSKLQFLPSQLKLKSLTNFDVMGCARLEKFPEIHSEMECLEILTLSSSGINFNIKFVCNSLDGFWMMRTLNLRECKNIVELDFLMKPDCFPELEYLYLSGTKIITIPESLSRFPRLWFLSVENCKQLREIQGLPQSIRYVHARDCILLDSQSLLNQVYFSFFFFLFF